ncbi:ASCH domain-containing protein [Burkholderia multivorans]|uniref:ASCH domain-containing protein n=1 Tax=Burkholderia multivorans TaxID=87883 RepID=UPI001E61502F|nr:ASCH domain-containing protein [Burkholderia multivorans]
MMKALSIRQPWAWLVTAGHKDIENRTWPTSYRGPLLIHASKGMTRAEYEDAMRFALVAGAPYAELQRFDESARGGIIGVADLFDCVPPSRRSSPWHTDGCYGLAVRNARPLPFIPYKGQLGIFEVPDSMLKVAA